MADEDPEVEKEEAASDSEPPKRKSMLYDPKKGTLNIKRLATIITSVVGAIAALIAAATQVEGWMKSWLDIEDLEHEVQECGNDIDHVNDSLPLTWSQRDDGDDPPRDPNERLDQALPIVSETLREHRSDLRSLRTATTQLSTIHEYGLDRNRARAVARDVQSTVTAAHPEEAEAEPERAAAATRPRLPTPPNAVRRIRRGSGRGGMGQDDDPLSGLDGL